MCRHGNLQANARTESLAKTLKAEAVLLFDRSVVQGSAARDPDRPRGGRLVGSFRHQHLVDIAVEGRDLFRGGPGAAARR